MLVSVAELSERIGGPDLLLVDCRFNLLEPAAGRAAWAAGHIPGAFYADLDQDLAGPITPSSGRHPLPELERFAALLGSWGLRPETQVVAYDDAGGAIAARLWWLLRWVGHTNAALLDGGYPAWVAASGALEVEAPSLAEGRYPVRPGAMPVIDVAKVEELLAAGRLALVDARDAARFAGEVEPIDPVAGHIPGSLNRPFQHNLDESGLFRQAAELRREFVALTDTGAAEQVAFSCGSGVTACHNLFARELAGLRDASDVPGALYVGSWSEWIRSSERPCAP